MNSAKAQAKDLQSLQRLLVASGPKPATNQKYLRLYNHNLCPFAAKGRYALALKQIPFQDAQVCLFQKSAWHIEANGGLVPLLETTNGTKIKESGIIMQFAQDYAAKNQGAQLVPQDAVDAAQMRIDIEDFNSNLATYWPIMMTRGLDADAIQNFKNKGLNLMEQKCSDAKSGWLSGQSSPSLLDVNCAPIFETMYLWQFTIFKNIFEQLDLTNTAPNLLEYAEKFRNHPDIKQYRMVKTVAKRHHERTRGWKEGEKCQLSLEILQDIDFNED